MSARSISRPFGLAGVAPVRAHFEDVATPVEVASECARPATGADGHLDLMLHFNTPQIVEQLLNGSPGGLAKGQQWRFVLTGALKDGTPIEGADCVVTVGKAK